MKVKYGKGGSSDGMYAEAGALITGLAKNKELREMMNAELAKYENGGSVTGGDKGDKGAKGLKGQELIDAYAERDAERESQNQATMDALQYNTSGKLVNEEGERMYIGSAGVILSKEDAQALKAAEKDFMMASQKSDFAAKNMGYVNPNVADNKRGRNKIEKRNDAVFAKEDAAIDLENETGEALYNLYERLGIPVEQRFITLEKNLRTGKMEWNIESTDNMKAASNRWTGGDLQNKSGYIKATR